MLDHLETFLVQGSPLEDLQAEYRGQRARILRYVGHKVLEVLEELEVVDLHYKQVKRRMGEELWNG